MPSPVSAAAQSPKITVATPKVDAKNDIAMTSSISVTVSLDGIGASLAANISSIVMGEVRTSTRTALSDGQTYARMPDQGGPR
jgi:hypothetical protein